MKNYANLYFAIICCYKYLSILYSGQADRRGFQDTMNFISESKFVKKECDMGNLMGDHTSGHKSCSFLFHSEF